MRVRTTLRPDQEIEVDDTECLDLRRMGLLVEDSPAEVEPPEVPKPRAESKPGKEQ